MIINLDTTVQRNTQIVCSEIDGEKVMMDINSGEYFGLDSVGARVWDLIEKPIKISVLVELLMQEFDVSKDVCIEDTLEFINLLLEKNLIYINK